AIPNPFGIVLVSASGGSVQADQINRNVIVNNALDVLLDGPATEQTTLSGNTIGTLLLAEQTHDNQIGGAGSTANSISAPIAIGGTAANDTLTVEAGSTPGSVRVLVNGVVSGEFLNGQTASLSLDGG